MAINLHNLEKGDLLLIDGTIVMCNKGLDGDGDIQLKNILSHDITMIGRTLESHDWLYYNVDFIKAESESVKFIGKMSTIFEAIERNADKFEEIL